MYCEVRYYVVLRDIDPTVPDKVMMDKIIYKSTDEKDAINFIDEKIDTLQNSDDCWSTWTQFAQTRLEFERFLYMGCVTYTTENPNVDQLFFYYLERDIK